VVLDGAGVISSCDTTRKNAFYRVFVKLNESCSGNAKFPESSDKVVALAGFLNYIGIGVGGWGGTRTVGDLDM